MNPKHEKFCVEYIRNGRNATAAYIAAGYTKDGEAARACASRLLTNVNVQSKLRELEKEFAEKMDEEKKAAIMDVTERMIVLTKIVKDDDSSRQDKIKAIDTMNKMDGVYVQKTQLSGSVDTGDIIIEFSNEVDDGDKI